jgi:hypothetical protein
MILSILSMQSTPWVEQMKYQEKNENGDHDINEQNKFMFTVEFFFLSRCWLYIKRVGPQTSIHIGDHLVVHSID